MHKDSYEDETVINHNLEEDLIEYPTKKDFKIIEFNGKEFIQNQNNIGKFGGTLSNSTIGEGPKTFNIWNAKDATSSSLGGIMFEGMFTTDPFNGEVIPRLAKSVQIDKAGKTYTVTLRKGLEWSDGKEITSDDVEFTYNTIIKGGYGDTSSRDVMAVNGVLPTCKIVDKYTVQFTTPEIFAPFLRMLGFAIAPKHILKPVTDKGIEEFNRYWGVTTNPKDFVISGPFKLEEYVPAQRVVFKKNEKYSIIDKNYNVLPYLNKYVVYIVGDLNNQVLKFEGGELDILPVMGKQVARFKSLEKNSDYKIFNLGASDGTTFLSFNLNTRKNEKGKYYVDPIKQKWFNDNNFRKAVDYAIDRDYIVSNVLSGVGMPLFTAEGLSSIYLNKELANGHKKDLTLAKELLKSSGFYTDEKGILHDKDGNVVEFTLMTNAGNIERESIGVMIKEDLTELGMKVNFKPIEFNVLVGKLTGSLDWDAIIMGLTGSALEPNNGANVWYSTGSLHMFNLRQEDDAINKKDLLPWEKQIDELFAKGATTLGFENRKKIYDDYQQIVYDNNPFIYLYTPLNIYAVRTKFKNLEPTALGGVIHNIEEIYIE
ncbi:MAG: ABC transporter substrate-binding protein [Candidatus Gastranaerophilales bacterium]|nr:ABC transporter substrate-binding protein [Candidatus Gastranaerophilales bacterium]